MAHLWALLAPFFGCIVLSDAGNICLNSNRCVPKENCPQKDIRSAILCKGTEVCCQRSKVIGLSNGSPARPRPITLCGMSNPNGQDENLQVHDDQAGAGQFPWVMALFTKGRYLGGGSLIAPGLVLSVAHLLVDKSSVDIRIRAGAWDLESPTKVFPPEERQVTKILLHEAFEYQSGANDLALLFLDSPFELKSHIQTICLPISGKTFEGRRCMVAGWGKRAGNNDKFLTIQQKVELPIVDGAKCQDQFRLTRLGHNYRLPDSLICAGGEKDIDACSQFGGSALFCSLEEDPNRYEQAGILAWGVECGQEKVPSAYTSVSKFKDWINPHLEQVFSVPGDIINLMQGHLRT